MKYANLRVLRVLAIAFSIIAPISIGLVAGQRIRESRAQQARERKEKAISEAKWAARVKALEEARPERQQAREKAEEDAMKARIFRLPRGGDFVKPASGFPQACNPSVSSLSGEYMPEPTGPDYVYANLSWSCSAGNSQNGCQMCVVVRVFQNGKDYDVYHADTTKLSCRGAESYDYPVQMGTHGLPDGFYTADIDVYIRAHGRNWRLSSRPRHPSPTRPSAGKS